MAAKPKAPTKNDDSWDSEPEEDTAVKVGKAAHGKQQKPAMEVPDSGVSKDAEDCDWDADVKKKPVIPEGPVVQSTMEASDWDDEDQAKKQKQKASIPQGPVRQDEDAEGSDWDDEDDKKKKKKAIPEGRASGGIEASGFDDEDTRKPVAMAFDMSDSKNGVAMSFDMGSDKPRKQMPKGLQDRLSRPKSASAKKKENETNADHQNMDKKELAKAMRKKSRTIVAPTKPKEPKEKETVLAPPSLKPHMKVAPKPPAPVKKEEPPATEDDACGAPSRPTGNFVAAKPKPATEAAPEGGAGDFLTDLLNTDTSAPVAVPLKGSANHGFVPDFHCTGCDHQVLRIQNQVWRGEVPYMFLRNNYPNVMRLRENLKSQQGCSAYCCQCSSRAGDTDAALEDIADGLRWKLVTG